MRLLKLLTIDLENNGPKTLKLCSSRTSNSMISLGEDAKKPVTLESGQSTSVPLTICSCTLGESRALLNAIGPISNVTSHIDVITGAVFRRWLFRFRMQRPTISQKYSVSTPTDKEFQAFFIYENTNRQRRSYEMSSSRPEVLGLVQTGATLAGGEKMQVPVLIRRPDGGETARVVQVLVFVYEVATGKVDTIQFTVNFDHY